VDLVQEVLKINLKVLISIPDTFIIPSEWNTEIIEMPENMTEEFIFRYRDDLFAWCVEGAQKWYISKV